jgi:hypothetical protein
MSCEGKTNLESIGGVLLESSEVVRWIFRYKHGRWMLFMASTAGVGEVLLYVAKLQSLL